MFGPRVWVACVLVLSGCGQPDPNATPRDGGTDADAAICPADGGVRPDGGGDNPTCAALATDYAPGAADLWPACISDDGVYHPFDVNIGSIARVDAFERIAALLFSPAVPMSQSFIDAQIIYLEDQGLESRVSRREDEHYPPAPALCRDLLAVDLDLYRDRCVGPAQIRPLLNDAFLQGAMGLDPLVNAARIEAGLLWFLYVSTHKEATTCATTAFDCDSHWAYYTGGQARAGGLGLSRYVRAESLEAHDRAFDGVLAVRCWRDLDNPTGPALDLPQRDQAISQLDRALLRGLALIVRSRVLAMDAGCAATAAADWEFVRILGRVLAREASARDALYAQALRTELLRTNAAEANVAAIAIALDVLFPCP